MPQIGEIKQGWLLGLKSDSQHIWHTCIDCGRERWVRLVKDKPSAGKCLNCHHIALGKKQRGENNPHWKGGKYTDWAGYVSVWIGCDDFFYPMARKSARFKSYILEHRLVMAKHLGRCLQSWEVVHHKNGIKNDNRLENLQLTTNGSHSIEHSKGYRNGFQKGYQDGLAKAISLVEP